MNGVIPDPSAAHHWYRQRPVEYPVEVGGMDGVNAARDSNSRTVTTGHVRLVYHYNDGHEFTTESMLEDEAMAYMPVLQAQPLDLHHYVAPFATIELQPV